MKCRGKIRREKQGKDEKRKAGKRQSSDKQGGGVCEGRPEKHRRCQKNAHKNNEKK